MRLLFIIWFLVIATGLAGYKFIDYVTFAPKTVSDKCTNECTDPNRPSYDLWGNEFDYQGTLLKANCQELTDPISGKPNLYCAAPGWEPNPGAQPAQSEADSGK